MFVEWNDVKPLDRTGRWTKSENISCYQGGFTHGVRTPSPLLAPTLAARTATADLRLTLQLSFGHHNIQQQLIPAPLPRGWSFESHVLFDLESWERIDDTRKQAALRNETLARHVMDEPGDGSQGLLCHSNLWDLRTAGGGMWVGPKGGMPDLLTMQRRGIRPEWYQWGHYIDVSPRLRKKKVRHKTRVWLLIALASQFVQPIWDIAEDCVRRTFFLELDEELPPFITVHIRRGDFLVSPPTVHQFPASCFCFMADF